jgi:hypothetical protein
VCPFLADVDAELPYLRREAGFRVVRTEDYGSFDNAEVLLTSSALALLIVRERGLVSIQVGPGGATAQPVFELPFVLELAGDAAGAATVASWEPGLAKFQAPLERALPRIRQLFVPEHVEASTNWLRARKERWLREELRWRGRGLA